MIIQYIVVILFVMFAMNMICATREYLHYPKLSFSHSVVKCKRWLKRLMK